MAKKSKLLTALESYQGRDFRLERQKKLQKQAAKRKGFKANQTLPKIDDSEIDIPKPNGTISKSEHESSGWESEASESAAPMPLNTSRIHESDSESESDNRGDPDQTIAEANVASVLNGAVPATTSHEVGYSDDEDDIPLSEIGSLASEDKGDVVPHQRLTINNTNALLAAHKAIAPSPLLPFSAHQSLLSISPTAIADVNDDLTRELAFYKQCLDSANQARTLLIKEGVPFSRPNDYFAEMVKSDEHMGKIKQKLTTEATNKKAAAEARKQRDLKKFGKQVQVAKLQERDKQKRDILGKIDLLKRKRKNTDTVAPNEEDMFDVALEDASKADRADRFAKNVSKVGGNRDRGPRSKRQKKDEKFGFGGKKRFAKSGNAVSSGDMRDFSSKKMKDQTKGPQRLGKSRRAKL